VKTFRYYAPGPEEQRSFVMQFLGTLLGLGAVAFFAWRSSDGGLRGMLLGAALALILRLILAARRLENRARRAQIAQIGVDESGLHLTDEKGGVQSLSWSEIQTLDVRGGRLFVAWEGGNFSVGAREIEDGMTLVRLVMNKGRDDKPRGGNFIPLSPK
jgi:MFS family permease